MHETHRQLETIKLLQQRLLPKAAPRLPGWHVEIHHTIGPRPGGDYYDFLPLGDGRLVILVGDASDEGGPSSVLVAMVRVMTHSCPLTSGNDRLPFCPYQGEFVQSPHLVLAHLNNILVENSLEEQYMTMFHGILSPADGVLHCANAGHPAPRWWHARTHEVEIVRDPMGLPLGINAQAVYHHKRLDIESGDVFVLYTDGVTAAQNDAGIMFGSEQLDECLREFAPFGAESVKDGILAQFKEFLDGRQPQDDMTLVALERLE
jgi:phosphoserine phosphatase RsbU/P